MFLFLFLFVALSLLIFYSVIRYRYQQFSRQGIPGPRPEFPFGNTKGSILRRRNIAYDIDDAYRNCKNKSSLCGFFSMFTPYLLITDLDLVKQIMIKDFKFFKNNNFFAIPSKDPVLVLNPFWQKDEAWKEKRSDLAPAMTPAKLKPMFPLILDGAKKLVEYIKSESARNDTKSLDARNIFSRFACDTVMDCTFGIDAQSYQSGTPYFLNIGNKFIKGIADSVISIFPGKIMPDEVEKCFIDVTRDATKLREESKTERNDFLSHIISLKDKKILSDIDTAGHTATIFLDGFETTAVVLHYIFYELAKCERVQVKLREEIVENFGDNTTISYDLLLDLPYLDQVFYEVLRLHPPITYTTRVSTEDIEVKVSKDHMFTIKKDSNIFIPIRSIQRDPEYYPNPDSFYPERFNPENGGVKAFKDRSALIPFGDGPRICLGMRFGLMQVKAAIVEVVKKFEVTLAKPTLKELTIGPLEFMGTPDSTVMLTFKEI